MENSTLKFDSTLNVSAAKDHIVQWMDKILISSGLKGWVIGVSGGIDSAVASTLAAKTGHPLLCLEMPIHQNEEHVSRARKHIEWLKENFDNISTVELDLTQTFDSMVDAFQKGADQLPFPDGLEASELGLANTRSRLRMTGLYYYANMLSSLVVGTGNKVEDFGVGFYTKYGDGGVDLSPIADLMKSEVYALAKELGIIEEIMNAIPSDGLWDDTRSDEDQIGATYDELEWAMNVYAKADAGEEIDEKFNQRQREVLSIYFGRHNANHHKMTPIPVCDVSSFR